MYRHIVLLIICLCLLPSIIYAQGTWTQQTSGTSENLWEIFFISPDSGWVVGANGVIRFSSNGGTTWTGQTSGTSVELMGVVFIDPLNGWVCGNAGKLLHTTNGGAAWSAQTTGTGVNIFDFQFLDLNTGWFCGNNGDIRKTTNGGTSWSALTTGTTQDIKAISFVDANNGWAGGATGGIYHTSNGGTSWTSQTSNLSTYITDVHFVNPDTGWVSFNGTDSLLYTSDGGTNWVRKYQGNVATFMEIQHIGPDTAWAIYGPWFSFTYNGGDNWYWFKSSSPASLQKIHFLDGDHGWAAGNSGVIMKFNPEKEIDAGPSASLDFGDVYLNNDSTTFFYVKNIGKYALNVTGMTAPAGFSITSSTSFTVTGADSHQVNVKFSPSSAQSYNSNIVIFSDDADESSFYVAVNGTGVQKTYPDYTADIVLGQTNFSGNSPSTTQTTLTLPTGVALDTTISPPVLYIADRDNARILGFYNYPFFQNGAAADFVIGQNDFDSGAGAVTDSTFTKPQGISVDTSGNLWVADYINNRVLVFLTPLSTDFKADYVFGQAGSFTSNTQNNLGISDSTLYYPMNIAFDNQNRVYICDTYNHRILIYDDPLNTDRKADYIIGQFDFTTGTSDDTDSTFNQPYSCSITKNGDLFVADYNWHRVLKFIDPLNTDRKADQVFGQGGSYTTPTANNPALGPESFNFPIFLFIDYQEAIYVSDATNKRILVYDSPSDTTADYVYGQNGSFTTSGTATSEIGLNAPNGLYVDRLGNLITADVSNNRILIYKKSNLADISLTDPAGIKFGSVDTSALDTLTWNFTYDGFDTLFVDSVFLQSNFTTSSTNFTVLDSIDTVVSELPDTMHLKTAFSPGNQQIYSDSIIIYFRQSNVSPADSLVFYINGRGFKYGDASGDFNITSYDASLIMQHIVELITLGTDSLQRAEVSGNGEIGAFDASYILRYAAGYISTFPTGLPKTETGDGIINCRKEYNEEKNLLTLFVSFEEWTDIYSFEMEIDYKGMLFSANNFKSKPDNSLFEKKDQDKTVKLAWAGSVPLSEEKSLLTLNFFLNENNLQKNIKLKRIVVNDIEYDVALLNIDNILPEDYVLYQNYPNPFNPVTTVKYDIPEASDVEITIYNILGQKVITLLNEKTQPGRYKIKWNGINASGIKVSSGLYIIRLKADNRFYARKMILMK